MTDVVKTPKEIMEIGCKLIDPIRDVAKELGYTIAIHGSLQRDIDLIAIPWAADCVMPDVLLGAICRRIKGIQDWRGWRNRPHRRMARPIEIEGTYIDFSVIRPEVMK